MGTSVQRTFSKNPQCSVIQLSNVPLIESLSNIVAHYRQKLSSISGVVRQCDYERSIIGDTVFLFIACSQEYEQAKLDPKILGPNISFPSYLIASIDQKSVNNDNQHLLSALPQTVGLFGLNSAATNTSETLINILKYFEDKNVKITGFRFCVASNGKARNFGFLNMFNSEDISWLIGPHTINNCFVQAKPNTSITLLLDTNDRSFYVDNCKALLTKNTLLANKFGTTVNKIALSVILKDALNTIRIISETKTFFEFESQFMVLIDNFKLIVYIQCSTFGIAMIGFNSYRKADNRKTMFQKMKNDKIWDADHAGENEKEMIHRAQLLNLKPFQSDETIYMKYKDGQLLHCLYQKEWMKFSSTSG